MAVVDHLRTPCFVLRSSGTNPLLGLALEAEAFGHTHRDRPKGRKVFPGCYRLYRSIEIYIYIYIDIYRYLYIYIYIILQMIYIYIFTSYVHLSNSSIGVLDQPHMTRCYTLHGAKCQQGERHPSCATASRIVTAQQGSAKCQERPCASCASIIRTL